MTATMTRRQQLDEARLISQEVRGAMSDLRRELSCGVLTVVQALTDERAQPMEIGTLLRAQWRWGPVKTRKFLHALQVGEHRRVRELTQRQIEALSVRLAGRRER